MVFLQRFGGALNLNPHFHALVLDGVYSQSPSKDTPPHFTPLPAPTDEEVVDLTQMIERKVLSADVLARIPSLRKRPVQRRSEDGTPLWS